jgi:hypothetical protein
MLRRESRERSPGSTRQVVEARFRYRSLPIQDLVAGQIDMFMGTPDTLPLLRTGRYGGGANHISGSRAASRASRWRQVHPETGRSGGGASASGR